MKPSLLKSYISRQQTQAGAVRARAKRQRADVQRQDALQWIWQVFPTRSGNLPLTIPTSVRSAAYKALETDPRASPILLPSHKDLPPAYIVACGLDPLRDDAFLYERLLKEAGVPVKLDT